MTMKFATYTGSFTSGLNGWTATSPVSKPFFSAFASASSLVPILRHSSTNAASSPFFWARWVLSGCSGEIAMNEAPKIVSWRVVKTSSVCSFFGSLPPCSAKRMLAPVDLPIQLRCWVHTKSGHVACKPSRACSSSSA
jgi:hypothetical protein